MLRTVRGNGDEGKVDVCLHDSGKLDLSLLSGFLKSLESHLVLAEIKTAVVHSELVCDPVDDALIEVVTAETVVTCGCEDLENTVADVEKRNVERTASKVEYHDLLIVFLVHTVSKSCGGRLVDYTLDLKTRDLTRVLGSLTLSVGEVCGDGDDSLGNGSAEISLCVSLKLLKYHSRDLLRSVVLAVDVYLVAGTHLSLDGDDGLVGVGDSLTLSDLTDKSFVVLERNYRRGSSRSLGVGDNDRLSALENRNAGVGCS